MRLSSRTIADCREGPVDFRRPASEIAADVHFADRGLHPTVFTRFRGRLLVICAARSGGVVSPYPPGTIIRCDEEIWVQTGGGHLIIESLRDQDGSEYPAHVFLRVHGADAGTRFQLPAQEISHAA